jgi:hypothetical protein
MQEPSNYEERVVECDAPEWPWHGVDRSPEVSQAGHLGPFIRTGMMCMVYSLITSFYVTGLRSAFGQLRAAGGH